MPCLTKLTGKNEKHHTQSYTDIKIQLVIILKLNEKTKPFIQLLQLFQLPTSKAFNFSINKY